jgi:hypothetical protein
MAPLPQRAERYYRGRGGVIVPIDGDLTDNQAAQIRNGDLTELSESQIVAFLDREMLQADHYLRARSGGPVIQVFGDLSAHQAQLLHNGAVTDLSPSQVAAYLAGGTA